MGEPRAFGSLLRRYRVDAELTQEALAERAGLSTRAISDLERGINRAPFQGTLERLIEALALSSEDLTDFVAGASRQRGPAPLSARAASTLPVPPTRLIGREKDQASVVHLLHREEVRLLTLVGTGGIGKTRLAIQVAAGMAAHFAGGAAFVPLAALADHRLVLQTIVSILGVRTPLRHSTTDGSVIHIEDWKESREQALVEALTDYLRERQLLLVLDNFEHLLPAVPLVAELLSRCPQLTVLVTSRAVLHVAAEHEFPVSPLALPDPKHLPDLEKLTRYDAVTLFIERARAVKPRFVVTNENASAVAEICARLDGLPLAIELAAARIRVLPPRALLQRLSSRLLTKGARDAPARQQTLRNSIDWSHSLLTQEEQRLFARLSVFAGGCTYEAAEAVCNPDGKLDVLEGLTSLVEKSLLREEESTADVPEEPRFLMLETIREYAAEKLTASGEEQRVREVHAAFFTRLVAQAELEFWGPEEKAWSDRLERELDNLRAALSWFLQQEHHAAALWLAAALGLFWDDHGHLEEGRRWLQAALSGGAGAGPAERAKALDAAGVLARIQGDFPQSSMRLEESLRLYREVGDQRGAAIALTHLGGLARLQGDLDRAAQLLQESLAMHRQVDNRHYVPAALTHLGEVRMRQGNYAQAQKMLEEALALRRELGNLVAIGQTLVALGRVEQLRGDRCHARALYQDALTLHREIGAFPSIVEAIEALAALLAEQDEGPRAARLWGASATIRESIGIPVPASARDEYDQNLERAHAQMTEAAWLATSNEGRAMSLDEAMDCALGESD